MKNKSPVSLPEDYFLPRADEAGDLNIDVLSILVERAYYSAGVTASAMDGGVYDVKDVKSMLFTIEGQLRQINQLISHSLERSTQSQAET